MGDYKRGNQQKVKGEERMWGGENVIKLHIYEKIIMKPS
jgi:hypothetical protein